MFITPVFQDWAKSVAALACVALLAACGGGGGKSSTASSTASLSISSSSSSLSSATNLIGGAIQGAPLNIAGVVTTLAGTPPDADGTGIAARFNDPQDIVRDDNNLYVADTYNNKIRKIVIATGVVTTLAGSGSTGSADGIGTAASFNEPSGITHDGANLYVADTSNHKIRKIVIATGEVTTLAGSGSIGSADGTGAAASFYRPFGITSDGNNLYVVDTNNNKIRKIIIATGVVTTLAGSGSDGSADDTGMAASFYRPFGITSDGTNLYVTDATNHKIRKIVIATGAVTTLAGSGSGGSADGTGAAASFQYPQGITSDGTNLYVADSNNHKIRKIVIATGVVTTLAGSGLNDSADGTGTAADFYDPHGITSDDTNLYVADSRNHKIRKIVKATGVVTTLAGSDSFGLADGTGAAANFYGPVGITSDGNNLYVVDSNNNSIRKIAIASGVISTLAGNRSSGTGTRADFSSPHGITSDDTNLYVADTYNHEIRKIAKDTGVVTTLAGLHSSVLVNGIGSADGIGTAARFAFPHGITSDGTNLYVADTNNHKIRKIVKATGVVTTLAGCGIEASTDGIGAVACFSSPEGITSDGSSLYVADTSKHKIRKIVIATGVVTTLAGSGLEGSADGTGTAASFTYPAGITSDGTNLYVSDSGSHKVRKIVIATGAVTTLVGSGSKGSADGVGTAASFKHPSGITSDGFSLFVTDTSNNTIRKIQ